MNEEKCLELTQKIMAESGIKESEMSCSGFKVKGLAAAAIGGACASVFAIPFVGAWCYFMGVGRFSKE
ncbi:hypothetical protein [Maridesulfovibrio sp.]|uniref:hypothetical protein n=1 Tax=Maridesulfovibrio sp. TaxID=2795000 RepID=UPI003BAD9A5C